MSSSIALFTTFVWSNGGVGGLSTRKGDNHEGEDAWLGWNEKEMATLLQELMENCISYIGWRRPNNQGDGKWLRAMDIFGFFQHFRCKFSTFSKFFEYILFSKDGNFRLFVIFRLYFLSKHGNVQLIIIFRFWFLFKGWNSPTFEMDIFGFSRWKCIEKTKQQGMGST